MKESYSEGLANRADPEWYAGDGNIAGVATTGAHAGQVLSSEITHSVCRRPVAIGRQYRMLSSWREVFGHGGVRDPVHVWKLQPREPGDPIGFRPSVATRQQRVLERNGQTTSQTVLLT